MRARARSRGYTIVEVLSAMTLFAIGAAGVISMQRVTVQGGADARNFDVGTNIAREWQTRLQRDSMLWTQPNSVITGTSNLTSTRFLGQVGNGWISPPATATAGLSGSFDILGRDVVQGDASEAFCAQYQLTWIANPGNPPRPSAILRAEIRVLWSRLDRAPASCAALVPGPDTAAAKNYYHFVYVTTAIRGNPDQ